MSVRGLFAGASGPGERIRWTVAAPDGVDLTAASTLELRVVVHFSADGTEVELSTWTQESLTAAEYVATYEPDGTEFPPGKIGAVRLCTTLTIDGVEYRYETVNDRLRRLC